MSTSASDPEAGNRAAGNAAPRDCVSCGACCYTHEATYIGVFAADEARMSAAELALTELIDGKRYMRMRGGHCVALNVSSDGRYTCAIYPARPDACRWLQPGSSTCEELITLRLRRPT